VSEEVVRRRAAIRLRVQWVLDHVFGGKQRRMAAALGVSQSLISRVVHGQQGAGPDLLAALAAVPGVNPAWANEGADEPLLPPTKGTLPIALGILPGWPARYPERLTGQRHPVADVLDRPSRYWVAVETGSALLRKSELALVPGDLILCDANREVWVDALAQSVGRLFGVRLERTGNISYEIGQLARDESGLFLDLFGHTARLKRPETPPTPTSRRDAQEKFHEQFQRPRRVVHRLRPRSAQEPAISTAESAEAPQIGEPTPQTFSGSIEDVVAMRVYTVRP
jgi:transcriptional regulator with XRE-family HTH domain